MFRASLCPSLGAYQLQQQSLVYRRNVVVAVLLVVVGLDRYSEYVILIAFDIYMPKGDYIIV
jgi:hypothetical protein